MTQGSSTASGAACWETPGRGYGVQRGTPAPGEWGRTDTSEPPSRTFPCPGRPPGDLTSSTARSFEPAWHSCQACLAPQPCPTAPAAVGKSQLPSRRPAALSPVQTPWQQPALTPTAPPRLDGASGAVWSKPPCKQCHLQQGHGAGATTTSPLASAAHPAPLPSHLSSCLAGLVPNT